jgi:hypothetical protein
MADVLQGEGCWRIGIAAVLWRQPSMTVIPGLRQAAHSGMTLERFLD